MKIFSKKSLGVFIKYADIEYKIIEYRILDNNKKKRNNDKLGILFHNLLIGKLTNSNYAISEFLNFNIDSINIKSIYNKKYDKISISNILFSVDYAINIIKKYGDNFKKCKKMQQNFLGLRVVGEPDLCGSDVVFEIKTRSDYKKIDLIQALSYTYLFNLNTYLLLFDINTRDYQIILVPPSQKNFLVFNNALHKILEL